MAVIADLQAARNLESELCRRSNNQEPLIVHFNPDSESKDTGRSSKATKTVSSVVTDFTGKCWGI